MTLAGERSRAQVSSLPNPLPIIVKSFVTAVHMEANFHRLNTGVCARLYAGKGCTGTQTGIIGSTNGLNPPDAFWQTHTVSWRMWKTEGGVCK